MNVQILNIPAAGESSRDCELICFLNFREYILNYHKDSDHTYWNVSWEGMVAYKVISEEFALGGYLMNLPKEGAFYEVTDSPWIAEFNNYKDISKCKHYIFRFYDETIELIARKVTFTKLEGKPVFNIQQSTVLT
jgi:hypothetical protein